MSKVIFKYQQLIFHVITHKQQAHMSYLCMRVQSYYHFAFVSVQKNYKTIKRPMCSSLERDIENYFETDSARVRYVVKPT